MMMRAPAPLLVLLSFLVCPVHGNGFLKQRKSWVDTRSIQGVLNEVIADAHGVHPEILSVIRSRVAPVVDVLPKDENGRVPLAFMRYAVQRYFSSKYGWMVTGFEPHVSKSMADANFANATLVLLEETPGFVVDILQKELSHGGFQLEDMVIAIAFIERLIWNEVAEDVKNVFDLYELPHSRVLELPDAVNKILLSYFVIEHLEGNSTHLDRHRLERASVKKFYPYWAEMRDFIEDVAHDDAWKQKPMTSPFRVHTFDFESITRVAAVINEHMGHVSDTECKAMKHKLGEMDTHATGRVKLADFYKVAQGGTWQFTESAEYLKTSGILDTSSELAGPLVMIPNYITGVHNCISSSLYYSVCCLNECEEIYHHLEARIQKPTASATEILEAIGGGITPSSDSSVFASEAVLEGRKMTAQLRASLEEIADHHANMIPLHGRLMAQWLHFAFPRECPYPHHSSNTTVRRPGEMKQMLVRSRASTDEVLSIINSEAGNREASPQAGWTMWSMQEELLSSPTYHQGPSRSRVLVQLVMTLSMVALVVHEVLRALKLHRGMRSKIVKSADHMELSHYI